MKTEKIAPEMAEAEFDRMCELLDIDLTTKDEADAESLATVRGTIVKAIQSGDMTIGDDGLPTLATKAGAALAFTMPTGATLLEGDKAPEGHGTRRTYLLIGALTRGKFTPAKCTVKEVSVLTAVMSLFLAA